MPSSDLIRWGGVSAILAGVAFIVRSLLPPMGVGDAFHFVALFLLAVGVVGFHALQKDRYGLIGLAGFAIVVIAALASVVARIVILFSGSQALLPIVDIGGFGVMLGFVLYGVATLWARVLPPWVGIAFIVGLPLRFAMFPIDPWGLTLFGLLWVALGYVLWSRREAVSEQTARVA